MIKHVSFDVWNTLITPNPVFSRERDKFLVEAFPQATQDVRSAYKTMKSCLDIDAETKGAGYSSESIYKNFLRSMGYRDMDWLPIRASLEALFRAYPPQIHSEVIRAVKYSQMMRPEVTWSIASNTNFIRGQVLLEILNNLVDGGWKFTLFSDELGRSKPHDRIWEQVISQSGVSPDEILHVGDNQICDGGAYLHGIRFLYVTGPDQMEKLLERI